MDIDARRDVLPWIKGDATDAVLILEHPHNEQLICDSSGFHYFDARAQKTIRPRGLTSPLAELFWPDQMLPVVRSARPTQGRRPFKGAPKTTIRAPGNRATVQEAARGMLRGNIIHGQIQALVSLDAERFHRQYASGAHPWSVEALEALMGFGIRPLAAELGVVALPLGIATKCDMVGARQNGRLAFVEWKTGYEGEAWTGATHWMRGIMRGVLADSALNRAKVQVVMTAMIAFMSRELTSTDFECWVVHISSAGTEFLEVDQAFVFRYGPLLYRALAEHQRARKPATIKTKPNKKKAAVKKTNHRYSRFFN
jgi:hypothetical protein